MRHRPIPTLCCLLVLGSGCRPPPPRVPPPPRTLPATPVAWPFPAGMNLLQVRVDVLRQRVIAGTPLADRTLARKLIQRIPALARAMDLCGLTPETRVTRVVLGLRPFDELTRGAVVLAQGTFDAERLITCLARIRTPFGFSAHRIGPYPAVDGAHGVRRIRVFALARNTVVAAVGTAVDPVAAVVMARHDTLRRARLAVHRDRAGAAPILTLTVERFVQRKVRLLTHPLFWFVRFLRTGQLTASLPATGQLRVRGRVVTRGPVAALRLLVRWKVIKAVLSRVDGDLALVLGAMTLRRSGRVLTLRIDSGVKERMAFGRLIDKLLALLKKIKKKKKKKKTPKTAPSPA